MITVKVQCDCGQRYAFDVEPVNGLMPSPVSCPSCGLDGTSRANASIALASIGQPAIAPAVGSRLRVSTSAPEVSSAPPPPPVPVASPPAPARPRFQPAAPKPAKRGKDGWDIDETSFNKLGTYLVGTPAIIAALLSWGVFGIQVSPIILGIVVAICGVAGGIINLMGRGPVVVGAFIGLVLGLGGFGAVAWWIKGHEKVRSYEVAIAFVLGAMPGMLLQKLIQLIRNKRAASQA